MARAKISNKIELKVYGVRFSPLWKHMVDLINEKFDEWEKENLNVKPTYIGVDMDVELPTILSTTTKPDIVLISEPYRIREFGSTGLIIPLTDLPECDKLIEQLYPHAQRALTWKQDFWALPWKNVIHGVIYNRRILDEVGIIKPPDTSDELVQQCLKIKEKRISKHPLGLPLAATQRAIEWSWFQQTLGMAEEDYALYDEDWNPQYLAPNSPAHRALQFIVDCIYKWEITDLACTESSSSDMIKMMANRRFVFSNMGFHQFANLNNSGFSNEPGDFNLITNLGSHHTFIKTCGWALTRYTQDKEKERLEAAWEFLKYFGGPRWGKIWATYGGPLFTPYKSVDTDPEVLSFYKSVGLHLDVYRDMMAHSIPIRKFCPVMKTTFYSSWFYRYVLPNLKRTIAREKSVSHALSSMHQGFVALKKRHKGKMNMNGT